MQSTKAPQHPRPDRPCVYAVCTGARRKEWQAVGRGGRVMRMRADRHADGTCLGELEDGGGAWLRAGDLEPVPLAACGKTAPSAALPAASCARASLQSSPRSSPCAL